MSIYKSAVNKPVTTLMIFVAVLVFGGYSLTNLPIDLYPELEFPTITVMTSYSGASATDVEANITKPLESALNAVDKLKEISSVSEDNLSVVSLEFEYGTDLSEASNDIRDGLAMAESFLPEDADKPMIFKISSAMVPILMYAITADESYEGIEKLLDERVVNPLNRIDGIGSISVLGPPVREVDVEFDPLKLESYHLTIEQVGNFLRAENINMPSGNIKMGQMNYPLRVEGEFDNTDMLKDMVLGSFNGQTIYLRDVATVRDSLREMTLDEKINGNTGVRLMITKQSGANTVQVARDVRNEMEKLQGNLPTDVKIETIFDTSTFIDGSINNLTQSLLYALLFVTIVVLFFLGRWRATFIIVLTIPISLIVSFIYLFLSGNSLNIISLSALSIAIGMVVDDAIVVLENISRHIDRGSTPREAAVYATNEVWLAVIVTTLTIVAVFFPMTLISGMTGLMFRQLGWIVSITVVTSTISAISLTPMLSSKLLRSKVMQRKTIYDRSILPMLNGLDNLYARSLRWSLNHKLIVTLLTLFVFIGSMYLAKDLGTEFMPQSDDSRLNISIELQTGTRVERTVELAREIDAYLEGIAEMDIISTSAGSNEQGSFMAIFQRSGSNIINYNIRLVDVEERERSKWDIGEEIRQKLEIMPEISDFNVRYEGGMNMGSQNVDVEIYGYDFTATTNLAREVADKIEGLEGARNIEISRGKYKPELLVKLDRDKMSAVGLNTAMVSTALYNRVAGMTATRYREDGNQYDVVLRFPEQYRNSIDDIENISLQTTNNTMVKLGEIGYLQENWTPPNVERKRRERFVRVSVTPYRISLGELAVKIQQVLQEVDVPEGILLDVGGAYEDQQEGFADILKLLLLSLILVYIVMASQFESFKMPLIIMFSIPFAFSGVVLALLITDTTLSIVAALGAVMLVGIVVKNAIVLVDYINLMRDRGYALNEAIILSGKSRLRPVLMTAVTTILAMIPLALSTGEGSEMWSPMGVTVIGGLIFSTIVTMILVPVIYRLFAAKGERDKKKNIRKKFKFLTH
jgi:HAE1 family hydrophobic/amphiphilic exporter-1